VDRQRRLGLHQPLGGAALPRHRNRAHEQADQQAVTSPARPLPHARLHDLRRLHATTLLLAGVPVHVVAARLGHADPAVTLRVHSHVLREHTAGIEDIFTQAVKAPLSKSVSKRGTTFSLLRGGGQERIEPPTFAFQVNRAKRCADLGKRTSLTSRTALGGRCGIDVSRAQYTPSNRQDIDPTEYHRDHRWRYCSRFRPARDGSP
jgi:hypothetical protein